MLNDKDFYLREIDGADGEFLFEMLYQSIYIAPGDAKPERRIIFQPELSRYVENWGRPGDYGLIAVDRESGRPIGAVWIRLFGADNRGYGYIDAQTPELGIAVDYEWRGRGIGTALLTELLEVKRGSLKAISLSVDAANPAVRLYRELGFEDYESCDSSLIMKYSYKNI